MERDLTTGNVFRTVVFFSMPYLLSYLLQTLYGLADMFIIGKFGIVSSTTAVSIGSQIMHMLTVMIVGLAVGATVMIGRSVGARKSQETAKYIGNTVTLFLSVSIVLMVILVIFVRPIVQIMSTPTEAVEGTVHYLTICFIGIPFIVAYNVISSILRGMGDSKSPMYFIAIACVINIILDFIFIGGLRLDAAGAALGTTISQAMSVVIALIVLYRGKLQVSLGKKDFKPKKKEMGEILKVGVPVALQDGFIQISFIAITIFVNRRGLTDAAAVGIVEKIISILFLMPSSMMSTVSALAAQNIGAGKYDRAKQVLKYALLITETYGVIVVILTQIFAVPMVGLFTKDAAVALSGSGYLRSYSFDCIIAGVHFCMGGYFYASGLSIVSFVHNVISILAARIPLSYFAAIHFKNTLFPMGCAAPIGSLISVFICVGVYIWMQKKEQSASLKNG